MTFGFPDLPEQEAGALLNQPPRLVENLKVVHVCFIAYAHAPFSSLLHINLQINLKIPFWLI